MRVAHLDFRVSSSLEVCHGVKPTDRRSGKAARAVEDRAIRLIVVEWPIFRGDDKTEDENDLQPSTTPVWTFSFTASKRVHSQAAEAVARSQPNWRTQREARHGSGELSRSALDILCLHGHQPSFSHKKNALQACQLDSDHLTAGLREPERNGT